MEKAAVIRATSHVALYQQGGRLTEEGKVELGNFFHLPYMHKFFSKFLPTFGRALVFYHAFYSKAKTASCVGSFYLKQLSMPDKYISDLGKRFHYSSGELQYFVMSQCK